MCGSHCDFTTDELAVSSGKIFPLPLQSVPPISPLCFLFPCLIPLKQAAVEDTASAFTCLHMPTLSLSLPLDNGIEIFHALFLTYTHLSVLVNIASHPVTPTLYAFSHTNTLISEQRPRVF